MSKYHAYPEYKDSGVEWLGVIPVHWHSTKIKYGYEITLGKMLQKEMKAYDDELKPYLKAINIQPEGVWLDVVENMWFSQGDLRSLRLVGGDVLISEGGDVGRAAIWKDELPECYIQNAINRARPLKDRSSSYLYYWMVMLKSSGFIDILCNKATIAHYTAEKLESSQLFIPPFKEAGLISDFLDHETAKIDTLIEKQQQFIQLLNEKRQAMISHAVTKGLNTSAKMRESGVLSIGQMPEHWTLKSLSLASKKLAVGLAMSVTDCYEEEGIPIIRNQNIKEGYFDGSDMLYLNPVFAEAQASKKVKAGDVVIVRTGSNVGLACCVPDEYDQCHTFTTLILTPSDELVKEYFTYCMNSAYGKAEVNRLKFGFGKDNLNVGELRTMHALLPGVNEQKEIISYLDQEVAKIELMVKKAHIAIELMQERRTALISAAVTGKIDVRDWVAPQARQTRQTNKEVVA
ncbi:restriction endonuclease subunit S [Pseudomonas sp. ES4]|uniref:restriction endonuclease subunit S n=1 Tax=Pseudomonas sp. ES4 TaxID=3424777 RepID=UPI003D358836